MFQVAPSVNSRPMAIAEKMIASSSGCGISATRFLISMRKRQAKAAPSTSGNKMVSHNFLLSMFFMRSNHSIHLSFG